MRDDGRCRVVYDAPMNQIDLTGKTAVVTGGTRGIGLAIVERMAKSGARVAVWDRERTKGGKAEAAGAMLIAVDVSDPDAVTRALAETEARVGPVDILVNSAAIGGVNATVAEYPLDEWRAVIDVNLTGTFLTCRAVVPGMEKRGYGRIINIASIAGKEGNPNACAYSASKAGVISLTKSLGKELATTAVRVNAIAPAVIETEMLEQSTKEHIAYMVSKIPMGRLGKVEEVAALVCWLASEECSFSTGAVFDISGGRATY
jgi:3-oxoacyl-[acyl-carrier protein] reductase